MASLASSSLPQTQGSGSFAPMEQTQKEPGIRSLSLEAEKGQLAASSEGQRDSRLALPAQRGSWATRQAAPTPTAKSLHSLSWMDLGSWGHS